MPIWLSSATDSECQYKKHVHPGGLVTARVNMGKEQIMLSALSDRNMRRRFATEEIHA